MSPNLRVEFTHNKHTLTSQNVKFYGSLPSHTSDCHGQKRKYEPGVSNEASTFSVNFSNCVSHAAVFIESASDFYKHNAMLVRTG